jgi:hypothetical protein
MPACVTVGAMRHEPITSRMNRVGRRMIICMMLIAALAAIWNLLGP